MVRASRRPGGRFLLEVSRMKKTLMALAAAATLTAGTMAATGDAQAQRRGWGPGAFVGGLAAGAIIGGALAPRPYYYYGEPAPVYVAPPPPPACVEQQWVWSPRRGDYVLRNVRVPC
jgi:hypothetical protein